MTCLPGLIASTLACALLLVTAPALASDVARADSAPPAAPAPSADPADAGPSLAEVEAWVAGLQAQFDTDLTHSLEGHLERISTRSLDRASARLEHRFAMGMASARRSLPASRR